MEIKVLGPGCKNCQKLEQEVYNVLAQLNLVADVEKVSDINKILEYDVLMTPALVVNGKTKVSGRVPAQAEIKKWLQEEL